MLRIIFVFTFIVAHIVLGFSQQNNTIIFLKNGKTIKGTVFDNILGKQLKVKTISGETQTYFYSEIKKTETPIQYSYKDERGMVSLGIAHGAGGLFGVSMRLYLAPQFAFESNIFYRLHFLNIYNNDFSANHGLGLTGGFVSYLQERDNPHKGKTTREGMTFKAGHSFSEYPENLFFFGWAREVFKKDRPRRSFAYELGLSITTLSNSNRSTKYIIFGNQRRFGIFWKCQWNFYNYKANR